MEERLAQVRQELEGALKERRRLEEVSASEQHRLQGRIQELLKAQAAAETEVQRLSELLAEETRHREGAEQQARDLGRRCGELEAQLVQLQDHLDQAQTHWREQVQATEDRLRALQEKSRAEQTRLEVSVGQLESAKVELEQRLKQLTEMLAGEAQRRETAEGRIGELDRRRTELEAELSNNQQSLGAARSSLLEAQRQLELQRADFTALRSEAGALEKRAEELKAQLAGRMAEEHRLRLREAELEQCIRLQKDQLAAWSAADAAQKADLQRLQATIEELRIVQTALCLRVRDLTAEQERASDRIRQLTDQSQEAARTHQATEQELAGLRHAVLEAARIGANISRERRRAQAHVVEGWRSLITTLLDTPLSMIQRGVLTEVIRALDGWIKQSEDARGDSHQPVEPPDFLASEFNCAEVIHCALDAVRENARETNRQVPTAIVGPMPERAHGSSPQIHQLITLLAASLPAIAQTDQLEINISLERENDTTSRLRLAFLLSSPEAVETLRLRLKSVADASAALRSTMDGGAELAFSSAWQLALALGGAPVIEPADGQKVRVQVSVPVQAIRSAGSENVLTHPLAALTEGLPSCCV
jgi:multidrug efflux pump subunit AcrA (membrane-fusion protein)